MDDENYSIDLQIMRSHAYRDDSYELDDWEGFTCIDCGHRSLWATGDFNEDAGEDESYFQSICGECGGEMETASEDTDWNSVRDKIPDEYFNRTAERYNRPKCPSCKQNLQDSQDTETIRMLGEEVEVHERCAETIWHENIEAPYWYDYFTPEHYEAAVDFLRSLDTVGCVITHDGYGYNMGELYVHSNYLNVSAIREVIDMFGGEVYSVHVVHDDDEEEFDCVSEHGACVEYNIDFAMGSRCYEQPERLQEIWDKFSFGPDDYIDDADKIFDADFSDMDRGPAEVPDECR